MTEPYELSFGPVYFITNLVLCYLYKAFEITGLSLLLEQYACLRVLQLRTFQFEVILTVHRRGNKTPTRCNR